MRSWGGRTRPSASTARRWSAWWVASGAARRLAGLWGLALALASGCRADLDVRSTHPPYRAHACNACHDTEGSLSFGVYPAAFALPPPPPGSALEPTLDDKTTARLRYRVDRLCFQCHKDLDPASPRMRGLWLHGPFKAGVCLGCHDPHQSEHPRLLAAYPWPALCARCHPGFHGGRGAAAHPGACRACHTPHAQRGPTTK